MASYVFINLFSLWENVQVFELIKLITKYVFEFVEFGWFIFTQCYFNGIFPLKNHCSFLYITRVRIISHFSHMIRISCSANNNIDSV